MQNVQPAHGLRAITLHYLHLLTHIKSGPFSSVHRKVWYSLMNKSKNSSYVISQPLRREGNQNYLSPVTYGQLAAESCPLGWISGVWWDCAFAQRCFLFLMLSPSLLFARLIWKTSAVANYLCDMCVPLVPTNSAYTHLHCPGLLQNFLLHTRRLRASTALS